MIEQWIQCIEKKEDLRQALAALRKEMKETGQVKEVRTMLRERVDLSSLLKEEDAKTRKNAALLMGDLGLEDMADAIFQAYEGEETRFIKASYLSALSHFDCKSYGDQLQAQYDKLLAYEPQENEKKHMEEEIRELGKILNKIKGVKKHTFTDLKKAHNCLLVTEKEHREITEEQLKANKKKLVASGVLLQTDRVKPLFSIRTWKELLFPLPIRKVSDSDAEAAAKDLLSTGLLEFMQECHKEAAPFYFRVELRTDLPMDEKSKYVKKLVTCIERITKRQLVNSTSDYEFEIRLKKMKDGGYHPYLKLFTLPDERFSYRKNSIAASIHPAKAALLMRLARSYMMENAQVLDPFCGVGTMLIERDILMPTREMYGTDIFGEAILGARENTSLAQAKANYINRDFFEFKHDYLFDEIVTNMPTRGKKSKEEQEALYQRFFEKAKSHLVRDGRIIMYSNENAFVKKQLRLHKEYRLMKEFLIQEKDGFYLFIIGVRG